MFFIVAEAQDWRGGDDVPQHCGAVFASSGQDVAVKLGAGDAFAVKGHCGPHDIPRIFEKVENKVKADSIGCLIYWYLKQMFI